MYKHIVITGRIDSLDNLLAANPAEVNAEYRLANSAPALRLALLACVTAFDERRKDIGLSYEDAPHIAAARQILSSL
jgi:hypothetical protein